VLENAHNLRSDEDIEPLPYVPRLGGKSAYSSDFGVLLGTTSERSGHDVEGY
jgi:hypothetical protein